MEAGSLVFKIIRGPGGSIGTIERVHAVEGGVVYLGDASEPDDVNAFNERTGQAMENYIPGFISYLVHLDAGEEAKIRAEMVP